MLSFKDYFQSVDVLIIDDLQFLQGKSMQQEFYHTFNSLVDPSARHRRRRCAAGPVESIDQRMRSRLAGGLVVDIEDRARAAPRHPQGAPHRCSPQGHSLQLGDDVVEFIANRITGGGRELEGALNRVIARHELTRSPVTIELAALALRDLAWPPSPPASALTTSSRWWGATTTSRAPISRRRAAPSRSSGPARSACISPRS